MTNEVTLPKFLEPLHVGRPNIGDRDAFMKLVGEMFDRGWLSNNGPLVQELESRIQDYLDVRHCVATCNGTIALEIAIRALGLKGEVILPSYTFIATAHALHWQGITPVFADINPATHQLDPEAVRSMITPQTTGIIGVHLWGHAAPVEELQEIADEYGLKLLFDAAHAFGCSHNGTLIGGCGNAEVLSFHATKAFNTFEGGAVVTNDDGLAERMRLMRNFGFAGYDNVICPGTNGKMTEVCAAMGLVNLQSLDATIASNRKSYELYKEGLSAFPELRLLEYDDMEKNNYHYIVVQVDTASPVGRDDIVDMLHRSNVMARRYFWPGCHRMMPYAELFPDAGARLQNTIAVADRVFLLPTGPSVNSDHIEAIVGRLKIFIDRNKNDADRTKELSI